MFQMVTELYEDVKAALDVVWVQMADISARVNVAVRTVENFSEDNVNQQGQTS